METTEQIKRYFANLNPLAEKIAFDLGEVKSSYDHVWLTLNSTQQDDILNGTMMNPEIALRYNQTKLSSQNFKTVHGRIEDVNKKSPKCQKLSNYYKYDNKFLSTFNNQKVGLKIIRDENIGDYRDEHSFPFSYKTKSQINLSVIASNTNTYVSGMNDELINTPRIDVDNESLLIVKSKIDYNCRNHKLENTPNLGLNQNNTIMEFTYLGDGDQTNPLCNLGSNPIRLSSLTESSENNFANSTKCQYAEKSKLLHDEVEIPKGFDFLSNW